MSQEEGGSEDPQHFRNGNDETIIAEVETYQVAGADGPRPWWAPRHGFEPVDALYLMFALVAFAAGAFIAYLAEPSDRFYDLVKACVTANPVRDACDAVISGQHTRAHSLLPLIVNGVAEAIKALAIAIAVSIVVANSLERKTRDELVRALTNGAQRIAINVFDGVFRNDHSPDLLESLKRQILNKPIVRETLNMRYTLTTFNGTGRLKGQTFTLVKARVSATFKNISTAAGSDAHLPLELSLPNPLLNELKRKVRLDSVVLQHRNAGEEVYDDTQLQVANVKLQESLIEDEALEGIIPFGTLSIPPGETAGFEISYTMMKEGEDSELLRSFHTTTRMTLTVIDHTHRNLFVRAKAIHPGKLKLISGDDHVLQWELNEIILPQQGVLIWWKEVPEEPKRAPRKRASKPPSNAVKSSIDEEPT